MSPLLLLKKQSRRPSDAGCARRRALTVRLFPCSNRPTVSLSGLPASLDLHLNSGLTIHRVYSTEVESPQPQPAADSQTQRQQPRQQGSLAQLAAKVPAKAKQKPSAAAAAAAGAGSGSGKGKKGIQDLLLFDLFW